MSSDKSPAAEETPNETYEENDPQTPIPAVDLPDPDSTSEAKDLPRHPPRAPPTPKVSTYLYLQDIYIIMDRHC
jgi:hypothetical protein